MSTKPTCRELEQKVERLEGQVRELQHTAEVLRESAERLDLAFSSARVGQWDWDVRSGRVVDNERWAKLLGYEGPALEPRAGDWESLIHPDDKHRVLQTLRSHEDGPSPEFQAEYRLRTASAEWRWILSRGRVVERNERGRPLRMVGVHVDIGDRKWAEEALRESEEKYKATAETAPDGVVATDLSGNITYASASCLELSGYERLECQM